MCVTSETNVHVPWSLRASDQLRHAISNKRFFVFTA